MRFSFTFFLAILHLTISAQFNTIDTLHYTGSKQIFIVPSGGPFYTITAAGADGGSMPGAAGGKGALLNIRFDSQISPGDTLEIMVGGKGNDALTHAGGGGATAVYNATKDINLVIAGAGGGAADSTSGSDASLNTSGSAGQNGGNAGTNSVAGESSAGGGGAGFGASAIGSMGGEILFTANGLNGGAGGTAQNAGGTGGFGGGGGADGSSTGGAGGGGGYSGGGGGGSQGYGGGGGSFNIGTRLQATHNTNSSNGFVVISEGCQLPQALCKNASLTLNSAGFVFASFAHVDNNSSLACGLESFSVDPDTFNCTHLGTNQVILTVVDSNANSSSCSSTVTITDQIAPIAICKDDSVYIGVNGIASLDTTLIAASSSDNCSIISTALSQGNLDCNDLSHLQQITLGLTDQSGNNSSCNFMVATFDTLPPQANCKNLTIQLQAAGTRYIDAADVNNNSADNCGSLTISLNKDHFTCADIGSNEVTLTVTDFSLNTSSCSAEVTVLPRPAQSNSIVYGGPSGCPPAFTGFSASLAYRANVRHWNFGDGNFSNLLEPNHSYLQAGTYDVTVFAQDTTTGCLDTISTAVSSTTPSTASAVAGGGTICTGGSRQLSHPNDAGTGFTYYWQTSTSGTSTSVSLPSYTVTPNSTTTYYVRRRSTDGCWGAAGGGTTVTVIADPSTPTISGGNTTICTGGNRTLTSSSTGGLSCSWQWQRSTNNSTWTNVGSNSSSYNTGALNQSYYYRVQRNCTGSGCSDPYSASTLITVSPDPSVAITGGGEICPGGSRTLTASATGGSSSCTYQWQRSNTGTGNWSNVGIDSNVYQSDTLTETQHYRVIFSCTGSGCGTDTSATETINVVLEPSISASGGDAICSGGSLTLNSSTSGGTGTCTYQWQRSTTGNSGSWNDLSGATSSTYNTGSLSSTTYYRVMRNCNGSGCNTAISNEIAVAVLDQADTPTISGGSDTICTGGSQTLTATSTGGLNCSWQWQQSADDSIWTNVGSNSETYMTGALTESYYYRVQRVCNGSSCSDPYSASTFVAVVPLQSVSVSGASSICQGGSATLFATGNGGADCSLNWQSSSDQVNWNTIQNENSDSLALNNLQDSTYYRAVISCSGPGCSSDTSQPTLVVVSAQPSIALLSSDSSCANDTITLNLNHLGGTGNCLLQWQGSISGDNGSFTNISGADSETIHITSSSSMRFFRAYKVCDGSACDTAFTAIAAVYFYDQPTAAISYQVAQCPGDSTLFSIVNPDSFRHCMTQWQTSADSINWNTVAQQTDSIYIATTVSKAWIRLITDCTSGFCDNSISTAIGITPLDTSSPVVVCQDFSQNLAFADPNQVLGERALVSYTDDCQALGQITSNPEFIDCSDIGIVPVEVTFADLNGNETSCLVNVEVTDSASYCCAAPVARCYNRLNVYLNASGSASIQPEDLDSASTAECGLSGLTIDNAGFACHQLGENTVWLYITDSTGSSDSCNSTVYVIDTTAPQLQCSDLTIYLDSSITIPVNQMAHSVHDNCEFSLTVSQEVFDCTHLGSNAINLTATDSSNNSSSCISNILIIDTIAPQALCKSDTLYFVDSGFTVLQPSLVNGGSTDKCGSISLSVAPNLFDCSDIGSNQVVLSVSDNSDNASTCTAEITIVDTNQFAVYCLDFQQNLTHQGGNAIDLNRSIDYSSDSCLSISSIAASPDSIYCSDRGILSVLLVVTDDKGSSSTCGIDIFVTDTLDVCCPAPTAICFAEKALYLDASGRALLDVSDIDSASNSACTITNRSINQNAFDCTDLGQQNVQLTIVDENGSQSQCTSVVSVLDTIAPTLVCSSDTLMLNQNQVTLDSSILVSNLSDNCATTVSFAQTSFGCNDLGSNVIVLTATDLSGNESNCTSSVFITDTIEPTAICTDFSAYLNDSGTVVIAAAEIASQSRDNCSIDLIQLSDSVLNCTNLGSNTINATIIDQSGNAASCQANVTVVDTVPPTLYCPASDTFTCGINFQYEVSASDNCGGVSITQLNGLSDGATFPSGTTTNSFIATDGVGLTSNCQFQVVIVGGEVPDSIQPKISKTSEPVINLIKKHAFGSSVNGIGDLNGDGFVDLAAGASSAPLNPTQPFKSKDAGELFIMFTDSFANVLDTNRIGKNRFSTFQIHPDSLKKKAGFGASVAGIGDLDGDGIPDIAVGEPGHEWTSPGVGSIKQLGALNIFFMNTDGTIKSNWKRITKNRNGLSDAVKAKYSFGGAVTAIGDLDQDGVVDLAVGAIGDDADSRSAKQSGAIYILFMRTDGTVKSESRIANGLGGLDANTNSKKAFFGSDIANLGDIDGDGVTDLAVGALGYAPLGDDGKAISRAGAVYILFMHTDGTVKAQSDPVSHNPAMGLSLESKDAFGMSVARVIDKDSDGINDLAVGAPGGDPIDPAKPTNTIKDAGKVFLILLNADGTMKSVEDLASPDGVVLDKKDAYGASLGALNDDCFTILAVGASGDDDGEPGGKALGNAGAVYLSIPLTISAQASLKLADENESPTIDSDLSIEQFIGQKQRAEELLIYPNPSNGKVTVVMPENISGKFQITLTDLMGNVSYSKTANAALQNKLELDFSSLPSGQYLLHMKHQDGKITGRLIITR